MKRKFSSSEILVHVFSIVIMLMAAYYYLERMLPFDGAFYSFRITETKWFCIDNYRYSQHAQLLPLLLLIMGCSLKTFLIGYSVSFALWNYLIALVILYVYKNQKLALGLVLATVLAYTYKFFYPVSEIHSTTAPLFLFAAHIFNYQNRKNYFFYFIITALIITWILFIHVISIIPAMFVLAYYFAYTKKLKENLLVLGFAAIYWVVAFMLSKTFFTTDYLASKMIGMKELIAFIKDPNAAAGYIYFKEEFLMNYLPLEILAICCLLFLIIKKEWLQILILLAFIIGTWFIIMAYNLKQDAPIVLMNYYGLFGFYCVFPFCMYAFNFISEKKFILAYVILMICSLAGIIRSGALMSDQIDYFKRVTSQMQSTKGIVMENNVPWKCVWVAWDLSFQSLFVSSITDSAKTKTFFTSNNPNLIKKYTQSKNKNEFFNTFFSADWFAPPFSNEKYYNLQASTYQCLNTIQDTSLNADTLSNKNIQIAADDKTVYLLKNNFRYIPIKVINQNDFKISSTPGSIKQVNLSYHVYDSKNKLVFHDGERSRLETDIQANNSITTGLCIDCTQLRRGRTYFIDVDMVIENNRWLQINKRVKIILI